MDLTRLYEEHLDRVYGFFAYRLGNVTDAEDLAAATFERAVRHAGRYDPARSAPGTWLLMIAQTVLVDHYRRSGRRPEELRDGLDLDDLGGGAASDVRPSVGVEPALERALEDLSERERVVVALRFGGDLRAKEIAQAIGTTEANVHQILSRSLRRLRAAMPTSRG